MKNTFESEEVLPVPSREHQRGDQIRQRPAAATDGEPSNREIRMAKLVFGLGIAFPFSRVHEHEADKLDIYNTSKGHEFKAAIDLWQAIERTTDAPEFLSAPHVQAHTPRTPRPYYRPRNASETEANDFDRPTY